MPERTFRNPANPNAFFTPIAISCIQGWNMDTHKLFVIGLMLLAVFVIGSAIWVIVTPPLSDEIQAYGLVAVGFFMLIIGYDIAQRKPA
jgi:hypothetical protein